MQRDELRVIPLGGLGEIGLNMMVLEYNDDLIVIDAGLMFPEDYMLGIDMVIPDISYLRQKGDNLRAIILTHGHEDHIGALPFVLKEFKVPVYGTPFTLALVQEKLQEHEGIGKVEFKRVKPRDLVQIGPFRVEFIRTCHSIVDGVGLGITTPVGVLVHTGDFKIDQVPAGGELTDLRKFAEYGEKGVLVLLSDSTNAEREGYTLSEREIGQKLEEIVRVSKGRVIVALFASNIQRIQQVMDIAAKYERKVALVGRNILTNTRIARELGYMRFPRGGVVDVKDIDKYPPEKLLLFTTGSQGEPMSALSLMAMDNHKDVKIQKGDTIILSSRFIPGNEKAITHMINHLCRRGAEVIYEKISAIHVSGHGYREELRLMLNLIRPEFFIPIHGEYRHLVQHVQLAREVGMAEEKLLLAEDGDVISFNNGKGKIIGKVEVGKVFVDGKGVGDVEDMVLRDRRQLSEDGMVIPVMVINERTGEVVSGPDIISRGFLFEEKKGEILQQAKAVIKEVLEGVPLESKTDELEVENEVRRALKRFFRREMDRRPVIIPVIIEM
ncbi:MAG: ribonuclease J [Deltaproteobacteria bacterium]|nr:MAG: ribonuclease J [Deltaproteobacteria bacterium]